MKFAKITETEISALAEKKAGGLAILVFSTLSLHDLRKTGKVFPSIRRISELLGGAYHTQSIYKALRWLEAHGFIKREEATSRSRFQILSRVKEAIKNRSGSAQKPKGYGVKPKRAQKRYQRKNYNNNMSHLTSGQQVWCLPYDDESSSEPGEPALVWLFDACDKLRRGLGFKEPEQSLKKAVLTIVRDRNHWIWGIHGTNLEKMAPLLT